MNAPTKFPEGHSSDQTEAGRLPSGPCCQPTASAVPASRSGITDAVTITQARTEIARIDKAVDKLRATIFAGLRERTPRTCQKRLDANPKQAAEVCALFRQRGEMQLIRDTLEAEQRLHSIRTPRVKKCAVCKGTGREQVSL